MEQKLYLVTFEQSADINASNLKNHFAFRQQPNVIPPVPQVICATSFSEAERKANEYLFNYNNVVGEKQQVISPDGSLHAQFVNGGVEIKFIVRSIELFAETFLK